MEKSCESGNPAASVRALFMAADVEEADDVEDFVLELLVVFVVAFDAGLPDDGGHVPGMRPGGKTGKRLCWCNAEAEAAWAGDAVGKDVLLSESSLGFLGELPSRGWPPVPLWYLLAICARLLSADPPSGGLCKLLGMMIRSSI